MRFPYREVHAFEDAQRNFEYMERLWGTLQAFTGAETTIDIWGGTGAPANANGDDGDFYLRSDGGSMTTIYQRRLGSWVGIA